MKKVLFVVAMLMGFCNLWAAEYEYVPLVREGVEWNYIIMRTGTFPEIQPDLYYRIQMKGDIIIDGRTYKKCYSYTTRTLDTDNATLIAYMREENKKVYMLRNHVQDNCWSSWYYKDSEYLLFDFNLHVGDPFVSPLAENEMPTGLNISAITQVEIDGKYRNKYKVSDGKYFNLYYIEGIGPSEIHDGNLVFPYPPIPTTTSPYEITYLNFERTVGGDITYKSKSFDSNDPSIIEYQYVPLVREGVEWGYIMEKRGAYPEPQPNIYYRLQMKGDITIDGKIYKKCYRYTTKTLDADNDTPIAFMREENKKVYMVSNKTGDNKATAGVAEHLLYDFNLGIGESAIYPFDENYNDIIYAIDKVEIAGKNRNKYHTNLFSYIEGIGPSEYRGGDITFPYPPATTSMFEEIVTLNYERTVGGEITYKSQRFDSNDPSVAAYEYVPTVREGMEWNYIATLGKQEPEGTPEYYRVRMSGTTTINGITYTNAYRYSGCDFSKDKATLIAYMREKDKKVYVTPIAYDKYDFMPYCTDQYEVGKEKLIYDYTLNVGDQLPIGKYDPVIGNRINEIKSIEIGGKTRKEFVIDRGYSIIEGIGAVGDGANDLIYPLQNGKFWETHWIVTFNYERDNDKIVYKSNYFDFNDACTGGVEAVKTEVNISLKITGGNIEVRCADAPCQAIEIVDLGGRLIKKKICDNESTTTISAKGIEKGVYILVVNTTKGISSRKIIL